jgi:hypothetical protein
MNLILNIGLVSSTRGNLTAQQALDAVNAAGILVYGSQVFESDTETTLVLSARAGYSYTPLVVRVTDLARELGQDCIAVFDAYGDKTGLYGPHPWGEFDGRLFLMTDGTRLVTEEVAA